MGPLPGIRRGWRGGGSRLARDGSGTSGRRKASMIGRVFPVIEPRDEYTRDTEGTRLLDVSVSSVVIPAAWLSFSSAGRCWLRARLSRRLPRPAGGGTESGLIVGVQGDAAVKRAGWRDYAPALFGAPSPPRRPAAAGISGQRHRRLRRSEARNRRRRRERLSLPDSAARRRSSTKARCSTQRVATAGAATSRLSSHHAKPNCSTRVPCCAGNPCRGPSPTR